MIATTDSTSRSGACRGGRVALPMAAATTALARCSRASSAERASTAPMVNSATGEAASASMAIVRSAGPGSLSPVADARPPSRMAHGIGFCRMPRSACRAALPAPCSSAPSRRERAMHSDDVTTRSKAIVMIIGVAAPAPRIATSSGSPMKPVFGKAATSAPKAASFQPMRCLRASATVAPTTISAHRPHTSATPASSSCAIGAPAPKRNSMHGSAKYSTKVFRPGMALSGSAPLRAAA